MHAASQTEETMLTFEGEQHLGLTAIMQKFAALPFATIKHLPSTCDVQPIAGAAAGSGGILIFVSGTLYVDWHLHGETNPVKFAHTFVLLTVPGTSQYYIGNETFRLNYA
eukprot:c16627_g1_i2.p3 GENE.c16627_g1_i2~~c16627_g1_i2.p3  ORF type:complete len:110 (+),score=20.20 c16627_g1_i2:361-690(+)